MEKRKEVKVNEKVVMLEKEKVWHSLYLIAKAYIDKPIKCSDKQYDNNDIFAIFIFDFKRLTFTDDINEVTELKTKLETSLNKLIELHDSDKVYFIYSILNNIINFVYGTGQ